MAVNYGSTNTNRHHFVADSDDFNLPNGDWTWLVVFNPSVGGGVFPYFLSHGGIYGAANSVQLFNNGVNGFCCKVAGLSDRNWGGGNLSAHVGKWMVGYGTRRSGSLYCGAAPINEPWNAFESAGTAISSAYSPATNLKIGIRSDLTSDTTYSTKSRISDAIYIPGYGLSIDDLRRLVSSGLTKLEDEPWWHLRAFHAWLKTADDAEFSDLTGKHKITRNGTGYSADESELFAISRDEDRGLFVVASALFDVAGDPNISASSNVSLSSSANLSTGINLSASNSFSLNAFGALTTSINLASSALASLIATAGLQAGSSGLSASATISLSASASISTQINCAASAIGSLVASGGLDTAIQFAATSNANLTTSGALTTNISLAATPGFSLISVASLQAGSSNGMAANGSIGLTSSANLLTAIRFLAAPSISIISSADLQSGSSIGLGASSLLNFVSNANLTTAIRFLSNAGISLNAYGSLSNVEIDAPAGSGYKAGLVKSLRNPVISKSSRNTSNRSRPTYQ